MYPMQERQLSLSSLFKKLVHNAIRCFSCFNLYFIAVELEPVFNRKHSVVNDIMRMLRAGYQVFKALLAYWAC